MVYSCGDERDCNLVLGAAVATYEKLLTDKYKKRSTELIDLFRTVDANLTDKLGKANSEYNRIREDMDTVAVAKNGSRILTLHQVKVGELDEQPTKLRNQLTSVREEQAFVDNAIAQGADEYDQIVWILEQDSLIKGMRDSGVETRAWENLRQKITELEMARSELAQRYGASHPDMQSIDRQINLWKDYMEEDMLSGDQGGISSTVLAPQEIIRRYKIKVDREVGQLDARYQAVNEEFKFHFEKAKRLENIENQLQKKQEEIDMIKEWLTNARENLTELDMTEFESEQGYDFQELAEPSAGAQVWPNIFVILGLGGLLGSLVGFGLAYLIDIADKTFRSPDEITRQLGLPLIGHIPVMAASKKQKTDDSLIDPVVCTYHRPKSQSSEAFRAVRTALYFNTQGKQHSVIQVTSPTPGDGKSTVACNLAVSIAQSGKRVLPMDDVRKLVRLR